MRVGRTVTVIALMKQPSGHLSAADCVWISDAEISVGYDGMGEAKDAFIGRREVF